MPGTCDTVLNKTDKPPSSPVKLAFQHSEIDKHKRSLQMALSDVKEINRLIA